MPETPLDPILALKAIGAFAKVALTDEDPTLRNCELTLREIPNVSEQAVPRSRKRKEEKA